MEAGYWGHKHGGDMQVMPTDTCRRWVYVQLGTVFVKPCNQKRDAKRSTLPMEGN